jgi:hypothetical protein
MPDSMGTPPESDLRFQFEVIKNLAESVRQQSEVLRGVQTTQITMLERLAKIESNRINETVAKLEERTDKACTAIDRLESERDQRLGGSKAWKGFLGWWGPLSWTVGILFTVLFLLFRATGIIHLPSDTPQISGAGK